jgi:putative membrane protein
MIEITTIPHINAVLNGATVVLLWMARSHVKAGNTTAHKKTMIAALAVSLIFMGFYLTYHFNSGLARFGGEGFIRPVYFTILIVHVLGAIAIVPLVPMAVFHAVKDNRDTHKRIVKWAWPIWFFVAVSGVMVYAMALHLWPCTGPCLASGLGMPS